MSTDTQDATADQDAPPAVPAEAEADPENAPDTATEPEAAAEPVDGTGPGATDPEATDPGAASDGVATDAPIAADPTEDDTAEGAEGSGTSDDPFGSPSPNPAAAQDVPSLRPGSQPGTVHLDRLGFPIEVAGTLLVQCHGVPESARARLTNAGAEITEADDASVEALVISTRLPPEQLRRFRDELAGRVGRTIVLAHTGAERLAAELIRAGADAVVGEGNEEALIGLIDRERTPTALLASFERRYGDGSGGRGTGRDPSTGLLDRASFERRLGTIADADEVPRVAFVKVLSERWNASKPDAVVSAQQRRLATTLAHIVTAVGGELFSTGNGEFGLIGERMSPHDAGRLGARLAEAAGTFRDRGLPLRIVVGHAGPESAHDAEELLDLARRAVEVAAADGARQVLSAEELALGVSVTTELEALVRLLDEVEPLLPEGTGHGERVGKVSAELARLHGSSPAAVSRIRLAGHLHDVGRSGLPPVTIGGPEGLSGELLEAWRTFPTRSAELLQLTAGPAVAEAVKGQRERWDGNGFPEGLPGQEIPESSRIIAVAHAIDEVLSADSNLGIAGLRAQLDTRRGTELDPELVEVALANLEQLVNERE